MREQRNDPKRLKDILQAIDTIFEYVENRSMEEFLADKKSCHTGVPLCPLSAPEVATHPRPRILH